MYYDTYKLGDTGLKMEAISGVDIALWDIFGKVTGLPIVTLLGGCYRERVRMYASLGAAKSRDWRDRRTTLEMDRLVEQNVEQGFTASRSACTGSTTWTSTRRRTGRCSASASR